MTRWYRVSCELPAETWPAAEATLDDLGAAAITQLEGDRAAFDEPGVSSAPWSSFRVEALFDDRPSATAAMGALRRLLGATTAIEMVPVAEEAWQDSWKAHWQPLRFDGDLCVCPSWHEPPAAARHVIRLDPGQAFGTGSHESTALCLNWLAGAAPLDGQSLLDYGCGSAVLALAAVCFGATRVRAVDIDEDALQTARDNVAANGANEAVGVSAPDALANATFDVLIANILLEPLLALESTFGRLLKPGGRVALAGILDEQAGELCARYADRFDLVVSARRGDWALVSGRRRAD